MLTYSNGVYVCDDVKDMVRVRAKKGDIARIGRETYRYNGGSWTKLEGAVQERAKNCSTCVNIGKFAWCNPVTQSLNTPCLHYKETEQPDNHDPTPCFDNPPYYVDFFESKTIGDAMQCAWLNDESKVWLNGQHIDGEAEIGDIFEVRGHKWRVDKIFHYFDQNTFERRKKYLLERVLDRPKSLGTRRTN